MTANAPTNDGYWTDAGNYATSFAGGSGTESDPYQIATAEQLAYLAYSVNNSIIRNKYYLQTADIDLSAHYWVPIGEEGNFVSHFNGNNFSISNCFINGTDTRYYYGLFGGYEYNSLYSSTIENVNLTNCNIRGVSYVGGICGSAGGGVVRNCSVSGEITNTKSGYVGGIVGSMDGPSSVYNCYNFATVIADESSSGIYIGGICGYFHYSSSYIYQCFNRGDVIGTSSRYLGGICGYTESNSSSIYNIHDCFNTGNITGSSDVGGNNWM